MEIKGKVYCFFEQSGTFKNEFRKLGYEAEDYDIQNEYGETDNICDLFKEIEAGYDGKPSIFDEITPDDLILAFFPCIYFSQQNTTFFDGTNRNLAKCTKRVKADFIIERNAKRAYYYEILLKLCNIIDVGGGRMIVENPYSPLHFLINNFMYKPTFIDKNRRMRGDFYEKPTQYIFIGCTPTYNFSETSNKERRVVNYSSGHNGSFCDKIRSEISPDYARNFICDFIIGKVQQNTLPTLF